MPSKMAASFYVKGGLEKEAVRMYIENDQWEAAYSIASRCMEGGEVRQLYIARAQQLEAEGRLREAERLYILVQEHDMAISMYRKNKQVREREREGGREGGRERNNAVIFQYDPMVRLVGMYHPDLLKETHKHLAQVMMQYDVM